MTGSPLLIESAAEQPLHLKLKAKGVKIGSPDFVFQYIQLMALFLALPNSFFFTLCASYWLLADPAPCTQPFLCTL